MLRVKSGFLVIFLMVLLWIGAVCTPSHLHGDHAAGLTPLEAGVLKTEAREHSKVPPAWMQITEAASRASTSDDIHNPPVPNGKVVWYGPFGVAFGTSEARSGDLLWGDADPGGLLAAWLLLLAAEFALLGIAVFCFVPLIRRHWPKVERIVSKWDRHF
jgi:hypothetical protein